MNTNAEEVEDDLALRLAKTENEKINLEMRLKAQIFQQARQNGHCKPIWGMSLILGAHCDAVTKPNHQDSSVLKK